MLTNRSCPRRGGWDIEQYQRGASSNHRNVTGVTGWQSRERPGRSRSAENDLRLRLRLRLRVQFVLDSGVVVGGCRYRAMESRKCWRLRVMSQCVVSRPWGTAGRAWSRLRRVDRYVELVADVLGVGLGEDRADRISDHVREVLGNLDEEVAKEADAARRS